MPDIEISFCTTNLNRLWQLKETLSGNLDKLTERQQIVLVDFGSTDGSQIWVWQNFAGAITAGRLVFFEVLSPFQWNMGIAKNLAHRLANGHYLFNLDADNFLSGRDIEKIDTARREGHACHQWTEQWRDGTHGRIGLPYDMFHELGGYGETFLPSGADDSDLLRRLADYGRPAEQIGPPSRLPVQNDFRQKLNFLSDFKDKSEEVYQVIRRHNVAQSKIRLNLEGPGRKGGFRSFVGRLNGQDVSIDGFGSVTDLHTREQMRLAARPVQGTILPRTWRVHVGAHKTATTHLQDTLAYISLVERERQGLQFLPRKIGRPMFAEILRTTESDGADSVSAATASFVDEMRPFISESRDMVLSEENILGFPLELLSDPIYPKLEERIRFLNVLTQDRSVRVFLSIRSFDQVLPGAYSTALRFNRRTKEKREAFLSNMEPARFCWVDLVKRIQSVLPQVDISVWRQEDYQLAETDILTHFTGLALTGTSGIRTPDDTRRPRRESVQIVEQRCDDPSITDSAWKDWVDETYLKGRIEASSEPFTFFDAAQIAHFQEMYRHDCAELSDMGVLFDPEGA